MEKNLPQVFKIFEDMARIYDTLGDEFRSIAYLRAMKSLKEYIDKFGFETLYKLALNKKGVIPNLGTKLTRKVLEILQTGKLKEYNDLLKDPTYLRIQKLKGLKGFSKKTLLKLITQHDIKEPKDIKVLEMRRIIPKLNPVQKLSIKYTKDLSSPIPRAEVAKTAKYLLREAKKLGVIKAKLVGSYARGAPTSGDIDLVVATKHFEPSFIRDFIHHFEKLRWIRGIFIKGTTRTSLLVKTPANSHVRQVDILYSTESEFPYAVLHYSLGEAENRYLRALAKKSGYKLTEKGFFKNGKRVPIKHVKDIFEILGVPFPEKLKKLF